MDPTPIPELPHEIWLEIYSYVQTLCRRTRVSKEWAVKLEDSPSRETCDFVSICKFYTEEPNYLFLTEEEAMAHKNGCIRVAVCSPHSYHLELDLKGVLVYQLQNNTAAILADLKKSGYAVHNATRPLDLPAWGCIRSLTLPISDQAQVVFQVIRQVGPQLTCLEIEYRSSTPQGVKQFQDFCSQYQEQTGSKLLANVRTFRFTDTFYRRLLVWSRVFELIGTEMPLITRLEVGSLETPHLYKRVLDFLRLPVVGTLVINCLESDTSMLGNGDLVFKQKTLPMLTKLVVRRAMGNRDPFSSVVRYFSEFREQLTYIYLEYESHALVDILGYFPNLKTAELGSVKDADITATTRAFDLIAPPVAQWAIFNSFCRHAAVSIARCKEQRCAYLYQEATPDERQVQITKGSEVVKSFLPSARLFFRMDMLVDEKEQEMIEKVCALAGRAFEFV